MRHLKSLREYIAVLERIGEIQPINCEVNLNLEIGAIVRRVYDLRAPAPLFNRIKSIAKGFRILGAPAALSANEQHRFARIAITLGLKPTASVKEIITTLAAAHARKPIPPRKIPTGACKENILLGDDIDLFKFPAPLIHQHDGGRYLNTWGTIVARTVDGRWTNWSLARIMIHDSKSMVGLVHPRQHIGRIFAEWKARGRSMPYALALGAEPAIPFISGTPLPDHVNEQDFLGGYFNEPIEVVDCETVDLQVPATSEIVIEGHLSIEKTAQEGPMGEFTGYIPLNDKKDMPLYEVSAITHRNNPILPVVAAGPPVEETQIVWGLGESFQIYHILKRHNIPVTMCFSPFESAIHWLVVTINRSYKKQFTPIVLTKTIADLILQTKPSLTFNRILIMDDDIDPTDIDAVVWGFATRCHPTKGVIAYPREKIFSPLTAYLLPEEKQHGYTAKVIHNCLLPELTEPKPRLQSITFNDNWPQEIQEKVLTNWHQYGY